MTQSDTYLLGCTRERQPVFRNRIPNSPMQRGRRLAVLAIGILIVALIALPGIACADDFVGGMPLSTVQTGTVTGDLWFDATPAPNWGLNDVTKTFTLPANAPGNITWARLYISAYDGHMQDDKAFTITNKFDGNGDGTYEQVWPETGHAPFNYVTDPVFPYGSLGNDNTALGGGAHDRYKMINDHENRVTSDYFMWYDVTNLISSRAVNVNVDTTGSYDGRIKVITLVVAYNDPSSATLTTYYVNQGHDVCSYYPEEQGGADNGASHVAVGTTSFATTGLSDITSATLTADYMASNNGYYGFPTTQNNFDPSTKTGDFTNISLDRTADVQGAYSGLDHWDVTSSVNGGSTTTLGYARSLSGTGTAAFYKIPLAFLVVKSPKPTAMPVAAFTANITSGTAPLTVAFTDQSTNTPTGWAWTFGDGSTSTEQNPSHTYTTAGIYTVALTAANSAGSNAVTQTGYITVAAAGSKTWDIYPTDLDGTLDLIMANVSAGDTVYFHNGNYPTTILGSSHFYNSVPDITWVGESRDGVIINIGSSSLILQQPGYIFKNLTFTQTAAVYSWSVRSSDDLFDNCNFNWTSGGSTAPIIILANSAGTGDHCTITNSTFSNYTDSPISVYSGMDHVIAGNTFRSETKSLIRMANTSSTAWFYLNNVVGTQPKSVLRSTSVAVPTFVSPSAITYTYNGNSYTNVLGNYWPDYNGTDSDSNGIGDTAFVNGSATDTAPLMGVWNNGAITYTASGVVAPVANFTATPTSGMAPLAVTFTDASTNVPTDWLWDFGDGSTSTDQNVTHTFTSAGNYSIHLTAANSAGSNTTVTTITVSAEGSGPSSAGFYSTNSTIGLGATVYYGEQGLNLTHALTAANMTAIDGFVTPSQLDNSINTTVAYVSWWAPAAQIMSTSPVITVPLESTYNNQYVRPVSFPYTGNYYLTDPTGTPLVMAGTSTPISVFTVTDPSLAIVIWDADESQNVNGGSVIQGENLTFRIDNNLYAALNPSTRTECTATRADSNNVDNTYYLDIKVKTDYGNTLTYLYSTPGLSGYDETVMNLTQLGPDNAMYFVSDHKGGSSTDNTGRYWATDAVNSTGQNIYPAGTYQVWADSYLNGMYDNYKNGDSAYSGKVVSEIQTITIYAAAAPVVSFTARNTTGKVPLTVIFNDTSSNSPMSWLWDFGDGDSTNATEQNPVHTYETVGTYTVTLTATNSAGSDHETKTGYITVTSGVIALPGQTNVPTDPNGDGVYEDLNGNSKIDYNDLQLYFADMDWLAEHEPIALFDFNGNGKTDYNDLQHLFQELS